MPPEKIEDLILNFPLILLAGGQSFRMGIPKGLVVYKGQPWLKEQLKRFNSASGKQAVVVLGFHLERYFDQMPWLEKGIQKPVSQFGLEISTVINPTPEKGQFSSLQQAIFHLQRNISGFYEVRTPASSGSLSIRSTMPIGPNSEFIAGAFILPIDVPCPGKEVFEILSKEFHDKVDAVIPYYQSQGGHPVLLSSGFLSRLSKVPLASTEARLDLQINALPNERVIRVQARDDTICLNLNTPDKFKSFSQR